jgi:hypothetical protein
LQEENTVFDDAGAAGAGVGLKTDDRSASLVATLFAGDGTTGGGHDSDGVTSQQCTVKLKAQKSHSPCVEGKNFGCVSPAGHAMWVEGCRGVFDCMGITVDCDADGPGRHLCACTAPPPPTVSVAWDSTPLRTVSTAATVEVDIMPFLARNRAATNRGGNFTGYFEALENLGSSYVRFAPWFPYWQVAVLELQEADCRTGGRGSSWNSTLLEGVLADFMLAVCGPHAAKGECANNRSVIPQLSTMASWLYEGAKNYAFIGDPWSYPRGFSEYEQTRRPLKDKTCRAMARYTARYASWYTRGGMTDECGVRHESGLFYNWPILSVMNEDETRTPPSFRKAGLSTPSALTPGPRRLRKSTRTSS